MQLLLDTHIYLWLVSGDKRLSDKAKALLESATTIFVSSATFWEIAIKVRIGKLQADVEEMINDLDPSGYNELPVYAHHTVLVSKLPLHHRDPFDRMLVSQAVTEKLYLLTADVQLTPYSSLVILV